jgi:hypothetical protein
MQDRRGHADLPPWPILGADSVVLVPPVDDGAEQIPRFAADVRPLLAEHC